MSRGLGMGEEAARLAGAFHLALEGCRCVTGGTWAGERDFYL